jgi:signal transduction histidine kinase
MTAATRLHGRPLWLARWLWLIIAGLSLALLLLMVPINLRTGASAWQITASYPAVANYVSFALYDGYVMGLNYLVAVVCLAVAGLIAWRRADEPIALLTASLLALTPLMFNLGGYTDSWWYYPAPWRDLFRVARETLVWTAGLFCDLAFIFLFPNGRFVNRWMLGVFIVMATAVVVAATWVFGSGDERAYGVWFFSFLAALLVGAGSQVYRYQRLSTPIERQQTKWVIIALAGLSATLVIFTAVIAWTENTRYAAAAMLMANHFEVLALGFLPLALAFSILRYRLWDIDLLLNRALVYAALTAGVLGLYVLLVGAAGVVFHSLGNTVLAVLAGGLIALLFQPLRQRLQGAVNRLMYGERDDPAAALIRLGQRLESALAPDVVLPTIVEAVAQALRAPAVGIALKYGDEFPLAATAPAGTPASSLDGGAEAIDLIYHGEAIGRLLVAPRAPGEAFGPADRRLLHELARQAAPAVHAFRLTNDLQRSRERIVLAGEEERRRLSRDLHDGLGPALASQALKLEAALELMEREPAQAARLLGEVKAQTQSVVSDVRRLVYELRPPPLDQLGLVEAIRAHAQSLSAGSGLRVSLEAATLPPLPAAVEVAAYRIVLEALTNVVRHAKASLCRISVQPAEARLSLEISDNGIGLPAEVRAGLGLTSMRERAEELGGACSIATQAEGGVRVWVNLPLGPVSGHG